jgi:hypothetical protein
LAVGVVAVMASASAQAPSPQQLEMLKSLSPSDRAALMEQLGISTEDPGATPGAPRAPGQPVVGEGTAQRAADTASEASLESARKALTFQPEDTVLLEIVVAKPKDPAAPTPPIDPLDQAFIESVLRRNPYQLDRSAALQLPGLEPIALGGLSEQQANRRLAADPSLRRFETKLLSSHAPHAVTADGTGRVWLHAGIDSGFEAYSEVYLQSLAVVFTPR